MDLKNQQSPAETVDLKSLLMAKEAEIQALSTKLRDMRTQRLSFSNLFQQNELYDSFQKAVKDKDAQIQLLKRELAQLKNTRFLEKMSQPVLKPGMH